MTKPELGTKRVCPETSRKFYDLNRDPIVSPYTGQSYPLSFFEVSEVVRVTKEKPKAPEEAVEKEADTDEVEVVSLEEADDEAADTGETIPDIEDDDTDDVDLGDDDDDTFLETDDDDDEELTDLVKVADDDET
ncbi:MAG: TIGR02300 family protein [Rhizobiaceae bacterium]|nr:TIGR02300 family protein [Rhizobiaceae bacterium]